ncbi:DM4/DM12 family [Popillia japonica]|uniref:DM4/DM12 family n=1 Tax=Popillia japonica TaxID=7064 RepID=A0AAW1N9Y4_POPJA
MHKRLSILIITLIVISLTNSQTAIQILNKIQFPYGGPFMGLFLAVAMPLEIPEPEVFVSYNFEANYNLPENQTTFQYPPVVSRAMDIARKEIYDAIEFKMDSHGFAGKPCLLRAICEATEYSLQHTDVLGDIVHVVLTPSTSKSEGLSEYEKAEKYGRLKKNCKRYNKSCSFSVLDLISVIDKKFNL